MAENYSISELARDFELTTRAIRFYEDRGLLAPQRAGRTRIYSARDRVRLKLILRGKRLGFSLDEISQILEMYDASSGEAGQLRFFLNRVKDRRRSLEQQQHDIEQTLNDLDAIESVCRQRLNSLDQPSQHQTAERVATRKAL